MLSSASKMSTKTNKKRRSFVYTLSSDSLLPQIPINPGVWILLFLCTELLPVTFQACLSTPSMPYPIYILSYPLSCLFLDNPWPVAIAALPVKFHHIFILLVLLSIYSSLFHTSIACSLPSSLVSCQQYFILLKPKLKVFSIECSSYCKTNKFFCLPQFCTKNHYISPCSSFILPLGLVPFHI